MNRLCLSVLLSNLRYLSINSSKSTLTLQSQLKFKLNNVKLYSSSASATSTSDNPNSSENTENSDILPDPEESNSVTKNVASPSTSTSTSPSPSSKKVKENISDRLRRLSSQSPEEYTPSEDYKTSEENRWDRYANVFTSLNARSSNQNQRPNFGSFNAGNFRQNSNFGGGGGGGYAGSYNRNRYNNDNDERYNPSSRNRSIRNDDMDDDDDMNFRPPPRKYESRSPPGRRPSSFDGDEDFDEDDNSSRGYQGNNTKRYHGRFEDDYNSKQSFGFGQRQQPQRNSYRSNNRDESMNFENDDDDMAPPRKINYQRMQKDYDLDDSDLPDPEEPRQSTTIRFANTENREAIKDAYLKRFPSTPDSISSGSKREFHSYAPRSTNLMKKISGSEELKGSFHRDENEEDNQVFRSGDRINIRKLTLDTKELFAGGKVY